METKEKNRSDNIIGMKEQSISHAKEMAQDDQGPRKKPERVGPHMEIAEDRWPEFRANMRKRFPEVSDSDLPYQRKLTDDYFGRIEKKFGRSREELRDAASAFYTWKA